MSRKLNKAKKFWKSYEGTILDKAARIEQKRLDKAYKRHRSRNA